MSQSEPPPQQSRKSKIIFPPGVRGTRSSDPEDYKKLPPILPRLFPFIRPHLGKYIALFLLVTLSSLVGLVPPLLMRVAIDNYILQKKMEGVLLICYAVIIIGLVEGVVGFANTYLREYLGHKIIMEMRVKVYAHVNRLSFSYFDKARTGDIMARVLHDTGQLRRFMTMGVVDLAANLITLAGVVVVLFTWNVLIGLVFLANVPFMIVGMASFIKKVRPAHRQARRANSVLTSAIQQSLEGIREVKLYGREEYMLEAFRIWNDEYFNAVVESNKQTAFWGPYIPFLISLCSALVLMFGGVLVAGDQVTPGLLIGVVTYFGQLARPLRQISGFLGMNNAAKAAGARVFAILDLKPGIADHPNAIPLENVRGNVEFQHVTFAYETGNEILRDISLTIPAGKMYAVVGPSGVGKTTLLQLVPRLYEVTEGAVLIDGHDVREVTIESLRRIVGIMMQDTFLFDGTIEDNIKFGDLTAKKSEVHRVAQVARLADFIESLPQGFKTTIGERGVRLSGGQAQRLSLARVLLLDPRILIMDEPTANIDTITDNQVMSAVKELMRGRTTLVIAHRLWTIQHADQIILLHEGRVEGVGTHQELWESSPFYREFFEAQVHETPESSSAADDEEVEK